MLNTAGLKAARKFADALQRTQFYSAERIQTYQRNLLDPLLRHARAQVPFYERRLAALFGSDDEIRWDAWQDIPTVSRKDAQEAGEDMFALNLPERFGVVENGQTSGSTGRPLKFRTNSLMRLMMTAIGERIFEWHNVNRNQTAAFIVDHKDKHPLPDGTKGKFWNMTNLDTTGYNLSLGYTVSEQADWLIRVGADILFTYPSNAKGILAHFHANAEHPPYRVIVCHGESLTPEVQEFLNDNGNIQTIDRFGASEVGPLSAMCPVDNSIHHQFSEICLLENLSYESDEVISSGDGRMVVTPFYNYAMPLIRYETYDFIETSSDQCSCGRTLPGIKQIHGRRRNLFKFANGALRWPNVLFSEYAHLLPAQQVQFVQTTRSMIEIHYVHDGSGQQPDPVKLRDYLTGKFNEAIEITLVEKTDIPKLPSGKFEDCISLVE